MKVTFVGAAGTVTGSNYLIETEDSKILVDCGLFQGLRQLEERNHLNFPYDPKTISHLLLTHAHIDHSGLIPKLVKDGFSGSILCTSATADLCQIMLADSAHIQEMEAEWRNRKKKRAGRKRLIEPVYTKENAEKAMEYFQPIQYGKDIPLSSKIHVKFNDAGHILGSSIIEIRLKNNNSEAKLVFSGDLGSTGQPIIKDPTYIQEADIVFVESTYGNRLHKSKETTYQELKEVIVSAHKDGGNVIIPAFAVERTQEVLYILNELYQKKQIPHMKVYVDSPLAISATEIFLKHPECFDKDTMNKLSTGNHPLDFPGMQFTKSAEESRHLNEIEKGAIIISASGMGHAGRIKHHLRHNLWRPEAHIVFVGFQAQGTTGRLIVDGAKRVKIFGEEITVHAKIHTIGGFSAHADRDGLLKWLRYFDPKPKCAVILHGEPSSSLAFADYVQTQLQIKTIVAQMGEKLDLNVALKEFKDEGIVISPLEFDSELDHTWEELDDIISRIGDMEDTLDPQMRENMALKLRQVNGKLDEIKQSLTDQEI